MPSDPLVLPVIMSGGSGTRLWPASTEAKPKQFHALVVARTLLQETALRAAGPEFLPPLVIGAVRHGALIVEQLAEIGMKAAEVLLEPFGRNTAVVAAVAAVWAARQTPGALVLLMPADHVIADPGGFRAAIERARVTARSRIVTFGIEPTEPATGYGYIQAGEELAPGVFAVRRFVEKPARAIAEQYLADGGYSWNAGIFLYDPQVMLGELERLAPKVRLAAEAALEGAEVVTDGRVLNAEALAACPSLAVDVAVMERTDKAAVTPCSIGWADIGSWSELWRLGEQDAAGHHIRGDGMVEDGTGNLIWSDGPPISVVGLSDIVVVASGGQVLVLPKDRAQDVRRIVERRKAAHGGA